MSRPPSPCRPSSMRWDRPWRNSRTGDADGTAAPPLLSYWMLFTAPEAVIACRLAAGRVQPPPGFAESTSDGIGERGQVNAAAAMAATRARIVTAVGCSPRSSGLAALATAGLASLAEKAYASCRAAGGRRQPESGRASSPSRLVSASSRASSPTSAGRPAGRRAAIRSEAHAERARRSRAMPSSGRIHCAACEPDYSASSKSPTTANVNAVRRWGISRSRGRRGRRTSRSRARRARPGISCARRAARQIQHQAQRAGQREEQAETPWCASRNARRRAAGCRDRRSPPARPARGTADSRRPRHRHRAAPSRSQTGAWRSTGIAAWRRARPCRGPEQHRMDRRRESASSATGTNIAAMSTIHARMPELRPGVQPLRR